jgi:hypothetical protein
LVQHEDVSAFFAFPQDLTELAVKHLAALPAGAAAAAAAEWLSGAAAAVGQAAPQLLLSAATAQELAAAEAAARASIAAWGAAAPTDGQDIATQADQPPPPQHRQQGLQSRSWSAVSDWVLGRQLDVWQTVFEAGFLQRGKALIATAFSQVRSAQTYGQVYQCCRQAVSREARFYQMQCV